MYVTTASPDLTLDGHGKADGNLFATAHPLFLASCGHPTRQVIVSPAPLSILCVFLPWRFCFLPVVKEAFTKRVRCECFGIHFCICFLRSCIMFCSNAGKICSNRVNISHFHFCELESALFRTTTRGCLSSNASVIRGTSQLRCLYTPT